MTAKAKRCPICERPAVRRYRPFCSKHCADVDLGRWLDGAYRMPAVEPPDDFDAEELPVEDDENGRLH